MTTTLSFRVEDPVVRALDEEAVRSGLSKSELMVRAVKDLLYRLACERDAASVETRPGGSDDVAEWSNRHWVEDQPGTNWVDVFEL